MPIDIRYNSEVDLLYITITSPVTLTNIKTGLHELIESVDFPTNTDALFDLQGIDFSEINRDLLLEVIYIRGQYPQRGQARVACVVSDDLGFGMMRMYEAHSQNLPQQLRVFRDVKTAETWLQTGI